MKRLVRIFRKVCHRCHGMGVIELPNGDTKQCPVCHGKGMI